MVKNGGFLGFFPLFFKKVGVRAGIKLQRVNLFLRLTSLSGNLFSERCQKPGVGSGVIFNSLERRGSAPPRGQKAPLFHAFYFFGQFFGLFFIFEKMAKKFVKQKLFCFKMAKNPKAVSGITFRRPQTPPHFFGKMALLAKKGHLRQGPGRFFGRHWTDGFFGFWPKSGGGGWGNLGPNFLGLFLGQKGAERGGTPFLGPFFRGQFLAKNPLRGGLFGFFGQKGAKNPVSGALRFLAIFCDFLKNRQSGFFYFFALFFWEKRAFLAKNPVSPRLRFSGVVKVSERRGFGQKPLLFSRKVFERKGVKKFKF